MERKLGRKPAKHDLRTLSFRHYLNTAALPAIPASKNWGSLITNWGMMQNDTLGDCTIAAAGHIILMDTTLQKRAWRPSDDQVVQAYSAITGYDPKEPSTDAGAVEIDVLNYWRKTGIGGHKILGYAQINVKNLLMMKYGIFLFGAIYTGIGLPISAQDQTVWDVPAGGLTGDGEPGSWGGHAVPITAYDDKTLTCVTWGENKSLTNAWWAAYGDEAYVPITEDWVPPAGVAPNALNLDQLKADLVDISQ